MLTDLHLETQLTLGGFLLSHPIDPSYRYREPSTNSCEPLHDTTQPATFSILRLTQDSTMCYHKYTHYASCIEHVPMHTHLCPKNLTEDLTRVIFCEDYQAVRSSTNSPCPYCLPRSTVTTPTTASGRYAYPTPPKTATPGSTR